MKDACDCTLTQLELVPAGKRDASYLDLKLFCELLKDLLNLSIDSNEIYSNFCRYCIDSAAEDFSSVVLDITSDYFLEFNDDSDGLSLMETFNAFEFV